MKTFYVAGSSKDRETIQGLGSTLQDRGLEWFWNWPVYEAADLVCSDLEHAIAYNLARPGLVMGDLLAARAADLFVVYLNPQSHSLGAAVELGVRLGADKPAHVILNRSPHHLFFEHPLITTHPRWDAFLGDVVPQ